MFDRLGQSIQRDDICVVVSGDGDSNLVCIEQVFLSGNIHVVDIEPSPGHLVPFDECYFVGFREIELILRPA